MSHFIKPLILISATSLALAACTAPDGSQRRQTTDGAILGGIIGGFLGATSGGNKSRNIAAGAAVGATVGGLIGLQLDQQEEALRASLGNQDVMIVNTGSELIVTLPEAITFDTGSAVVRPSLRGDLAVLADNLNQFPDTSLDIIGHTDNVGAASFNQRLSAQRADSVLAILGNEGVDPSRMRAIGRGESEPKVTNLTEYGRAQNRRVEVVIRPTG